MAAGAAVGRIGLLYPPLSAGEAVQVSMTDYRTFGFGWYCHGEST